MSNVRTVSDTKRDFYTHHTRPINSIYRRVVDELLVEMHLLQVNVDFIYDPIYALGVVTTFDRFMVGYQPEADRDSIFKALCQANGRSAEQYRNDAEMVKASVAGMSLETFKAQFDTLEGSAHTGGLRGFLEAIAAQPKFKYSRPLGIGLYTLIETIDPEVLGDTEKRNELLNFIGEALHLSADKLQKDLDLYRSNLEKFAQAQEVMQDILAADRKKREQREENKVTEMASIPASDTPTEDTPAAE